MSETRNQFGRKSITQKSKKLPVRLDLSAMVSIAFLLMVFFMLTSYMSRPQIMDLGMPKGRGCVDYIGCFDLSDLRTMTILIGENDKIISYHGNFESPIESPKLLTYNKESLRKELVEKSKLILSQTADPKKGLIVKIKPSKKATYKNLVDVLDEMAILKIPVYTVLDITPEENQLLRSFETH
ncbi:ExbD/TolR family protein [Flavobacterium oreochromis]|uniref:ExbD/TolR family protein n=1 Tax=Flavobacterium oreochromis TaxID=2906078 RepID=UPI00385E5616